MTPTESQMNETGFVISKDLKAFEANLRVRSDRPAESMVDLMSISEKEVRHAAAFVTQTLKRFAKAIVDSMDDPSSVNDFLSELDLKLIAKDHDWHEIFTGLAGKGSSYEPHKRVLIIKYLQYLSTRKRLLGQVLSRRAALDDTYGHVEHAPQSKAGEDKDADGMLETTDLGFLVPDQFERLQMGESIRLNFPEECTFNLMLAKHVFRLTRSTEPQFIAPDGNAQALKAGRSMVGRHPECDIVADRNFRDISRVHVIIEWNNEPWLKLTDLSTLGTFVPTKMISD